jgi:pimeloyl-ACP methyl ester carboxylesterase
MLHRVDAGAARGTAVLICPPFGWQDACSFRGLRSWGRALATAGFPSARLVLPATGDSAGDESDLQAWIDATAASVEWLRQVTGCRRVAAIGIGLGGIIACCAQSGGAPVDDLVLWAVPARGRRLLRELRSLAQIIAALHPEDEAEDSADGADLNLIGYPMRRATADELERLDLAVLPAPPVSGRRVLMLGRDGIAADQRLTCNRPRPRSSSPMAAIGLT